MKENQIIVTKEITREEYERNSKAYLSAVWDLQKTEPPMSMRLFLLHMNNFFLNFSPKWIGDAYRKEAHYVAATKVDGFNELQERIKNNFKQIKNPVSPMHVFTTDYMQVHLDLYHSYLIMRDFVEGGDAELFR